MGEPAVPSAADIATTLQLARDVVAAEADDEPWPRLPDQLRPFCDDLYGDELDAVAAICQLLVAKVDECERYRRALVQWRDSRDWANDPRTMDVELGLLAALDAKEPVQ